MEVVGDTRVVFAGRVDDAAGIEEVVDFADERVVFDEVGDGV